MTLTAEKKKRLMLVVIMGLMVLIAAYYFGFRGINNAREATDRKEHQLGDQVKKANQTIEAGDAAGKKLVVIEEKLKPIRDQLPPEEAETWLARAMYAVAKRHDMQPKGSRLCDPDPFTLDELKAFKHFKLVGYAFSVQGNYFRLGEFLADLEGSHPMLVVENVVITAGASGEPHIHEMALRVNMVANKD
jgi:Tfp pilus assembly protein PilO